LAMVPAEISSLRFSDIAGNRLARVFLQLPGELT
jgi:hypothetical protein